MGTASKRFRQPHQSQTKASKWVAFGKEEVGGREEGVACYDEESTGRGQQAGVVTVIAAARIIHIK